MHDSHETVINHVYQFIFQERIWQELMNWHNIFMIGYLFFTGWGTTEFAGALSNTLQKVKLGVTNYLTCKKFFSDIEYRQICTFAEGKDACQVAFIYFE